MIKGECVVLAIMLSLAEDDDRETVLPAPTPSPSAFEIQKVWSCEWPRLHYSRADPSLPPSSSIASARKNQEFLLCPGCEHVPLPCGRWGRESCGIEGGLNCTERLTSPCILPEGLTSWQAKYWSLPAAFWMMSCKGM